MTFADFIEVDKNLATFGGVDSELDPSSTSEEVSREVAQREGTSTEETQCALVTASEASKALASLINHCSQSGEILFGVNEAFHKYREKFIVDHLRSKRQADIRFFSSKLTLEAGPGS